MWRCHNQGEGALMALADLNLRRLASIMWNVCPPNTWSVSARDNGLCPPETWPLLGAPQRGEVPGTLSDELLFQHIR